MGSVPDVVGTESMFASHREPAWHGLGTVFTDLVSDYPTMLKRAHLAGWDLRFAPTPPAVAGATFVGPVPQQVLRTNPLTKGTDILGSVGKRYALVSNETVFSGAQSLVDPDKGIQWETAGAMGATVFGSLVLDNEIVLDPTGVADVIKSYILVATSHDGTSSLSYTTTPVRVVCQNTLSAALSGNKNVFRVRHTESAEKRIAEAREALGMSTAYLARFEKEAQALIAKSQTRKQFFDIVSALYPKPEKDAKGSFTKWDNRMAVIGERYSATTNDVGDNAWKGVNTLTEVLQWGRKVRAGNTDNFYAAGAGFDAVTNVERSRIVNAFIDA